MVGAQPLQVMTGTLGASAPRLILKLMLQRSSYPRQSFSARSGIYLWRPQKTYLEQLLQIVHSTRQRASFATDAAEAEPTISVYTWFAA